MTLEIRSEARYVARGAMLGQVNCRDAHKPNMTFREMLECYHRFYHDAVRLFSRGLAESRN